MLPPRSRADRGSIPAAEAIALFERAESQELQKGQKGSAGASSSGRARRPSEEALARAQRSELNTLLLERVLLGTLGVDV